MKVINVFLLLLGCFATAYCQERSMDMLKLQKVVSEFEQSIIQKDSVRFKKLFFHEKVAFVGIMSEATEMSIKKDYPEFQGIAVSNCSKFIREICTSDKQQTERFYKIQISANAPIASISFDYSFLSGNKMIQWGNEKWNLVYADNQWLITDVVYSIHFPHIEPFPYEEE